MRKTDRSRGPQMNSSMYTRRSTIMYSQPALLVQLMQAFGSTYNEDTGNFGEQVRVHGMPSFNKDIKDSNTQCTTVHGRQVGQHVRSCRRVRREVDHLLLHGVQLAKEERVLLLQYAASLVGLLFLLSSQLAGSSSGVVVLSAAFFVDLN